MIRTLIRFRADELISYANHSADDVVALKSCLHEIQFRKKALKAGKFEKIIPWIKNRVETLECDIKPPVSIDEEDSIDQVFVEPQRATRFLLSADELNAFILLCACFVLLDKDFSDEEMEFIDRLLEAENIDAEAFGAAFNSVIGKDVRKIAEKQILALQSLSRTQKQDILDTLFELSLADNFLHVNEKLFLEDMNKYWGLQVVFGKGELNWTKEQLQVIEADEERRIVVNAMPGAGKTAVACAKISHLIDEGVSASKIWLLSFTRTAVQELRDRIASFADEDMDVIGVKIATIDSRAWQLRFGMTDEKGNNLFQSYDLSISEALQLLKDNPEDFEQDFEGISHVIIDEAQDITGVRLQFIEQMVKMLPSTCGVTIFGDEAQAIYGFTSDEDISDEGINATGQNYLRIVKERYPEDFEFLQLNSMHRTENINLRRLIDELRLNIQVDNPELVIKPKDAAKKITQAADQSGITFKAEEIRGLDDTLILFRRRSDVLQACNFANQSNVRHRIRMGGLPVVCRPWIGQLLFGKNNELISSDEFNEFWQEKGNKILDCGDSAFSGFKRLMSVAKQGGKISVKKLRTAASRPVPPVELCVPDLGTEGPILGTIHASKGREAENVRLFMSSNSKSSASDEEKAEETRVLFVGASRAKQSLSVGKGYVFGGSTLNGRSYKQVKRQNKVQVEIGKAIDFDIYSLVNKKIVTNDKAIALQRTLVELTSSGPIDVEAIQNPSANFVYDLYIVPQQIWIGRFHQQLNHDLFKIKGLINSHGNRRLPKKIPHLKLVGLTTAAIPDNQNEHPMAETVVKTARDSGFWLSPTIIGYPTIWL